MLFRSAVADNDEDWYRARGHARRALKDYGAVLMRKDPPFDLEYVTSTWMLSAAEREGARVGGRGRGHLALEKKHVAEAEVRGGARGLRAEHGLELGARLGDPSGAVVEDVREHAVPGSARDCADEDEGCGAGVREAGGHTGGPVRQFGVVDRNDDWVGR
mgnify:CR=1 FL=1